MTRARSLTLPALLFVTVIVSCSAQAQARPSAVYQRSLERGTLEPRVRAFVSACLHTGVLPKPIGLYSQGAWFVTPSLAEHVVQDGSDDDGTARIWSIGGKPRALSLWTHDDEFDRSTLACLDDDGGVVRLVNEYMPGLSEPDLRYIYVHTFTRMPDGKYRAAGRFTSWGREPIGAPRLTSEDRDFIAGERRYTRWQDFDFAGALARN